MISLVMVYNAASEDGEALFCGDTFAEVDRKFDLLKGTARKAARVGWRPKGMIIEKVLLDEDPAEFHAGLAV